MNFYGMQSNIYKGKLFSSGYSGILIAYDIKTGKQLWISLKNMPGNILI